MMDGWMDERVEMEDRGDVRSEERERERIYYPLSPKWSR